MGLSLQIANTKHNNLAKAWSCSDKLQAYATLIKSKLEYDSAAWGPFTD